MNLLRGKLSVPQNVEDSVDLGNKPVWIVRINPTSKVVHDAVIQLVVLLLLGVGIPEATFAVFAGLDQDSSVIRAEWQWVQIS